MSDESGYQPLNLFTLPSWRKCYVLESDRGGLSDEFGEFTETPGDVLEQVRYMMDRVANRLEVEHAVDPIASAEIKISVDPLQVATHTKIVRAS